MDDPKKDISEARSEAPSLKVRFFDGKGHHAFIHQKSHKLASAVYLVTELVKDNEPLKWKMREKALILISHNLSLASSFTDNKKTLSDNLSMVCLELISLIEIGRTAQVISAMNFSILRKEFLDLLTFMETKEHEHFGSGSPVLTEDFFKADNAGSSLNPHDVLYKGQNSVFDKMSFISTLSHNPLPAPAPQNTLAVRTYHSNKTPVIKGKENSHTVGDTERFQVKDKKDDRREAILRAIKKMKEVTINDIVGVITGCSEKTIQRELLALVSEGVLKKVGERRWSKYSIN